MNYYVNAEEQISIDDWMAAEAAVATFFREDNQGNLQDADWWQWEPDGQYVMHKSRINNIVTTIDKIYPGEKLHEMCRSGLHVLSYVDAFDKYYSSAPLSYLDMIDLSVHGRNLRRYIKQQGVHYLAFDRTRSEDYIVKMIYSQAIEYAYSVAFEDEIPRIKEWAERLGKEFNEETLSRWYGVGGSCGPDTIDLKHDYRGIEISWSNAEEGGIYPLKLTWARVLVIMKQLYGDDERTEGRDGTP